MAVDTAGHWIQPLKCGHLLRKSISSTISTRVKIYIYSWPRAPPFLSCEMFWCTSPQIIKVIGKAIWCGDAESYSYSVRMQSIPWLQTLNTYGHSPGVVGIHISEYICLKNIFEIPGPKTIHDCLFKFAAIKYILYAINSQQFVKTFKFFRAT